MGTAPKSVRIGSPGALEQPIKYHFSPQRGQWLIRSWRGPKAAIVALLPQFGLFTWELEYGAAGRGDVWELRATTAQAVDSFTGGSDESTVLANVWELVPNLVEKDILASDSPAIAGIGPQLLQALRTSIEANDATLSIFIKNIQALSPPITSSYAGWQNALDLWVAMKLGLRSVPIYQPVLRHTQVTSLAYVIAPTFINVGKILATTSITAGSANSAAENIVGTAPLLAAALVNINKNLAVPAAVPADPAGSDSLLVNYGWLKGFPTINQTALNKYQIQQEWQFGLWSQLVYGTPL